MKIKKKMIALILGSILLTGCGSNSNVERDTRPAESTEKESGSDEKTEQAGTYEELDISTTPATGAGEQGNRSKILIAYFTRSDNINIDPNVDAISSASINLNGSEYQGNLAIMADYIQEITGGDTFSILTSKIYPSEYRATTDVAKEEQNDDARPELSNHVETVVLMSRVKD